MTTWKSFQTRALSALVALIIIIFFYYLWNIRGLQFVIFAAVVIGARELQGLLLKKESSSLLRSLFFMLTLLVFAGSSLAINISGIAFASAFIISIIVSLLALHKTGDLERMLRFQAAAAVGLFYMGLLPSFAYRILSQENGLSWFIFLLTVVFAGDTMAYGFGVLLGKNKVMPSVSPKKTWEGSFGGIVGSVTAAAICGFYLLPDLSLGWLLPLGALAGFFGQFGDFFESLLKRAADVKDSGNIMPGHGGVLDRIDGVLFASPIVLLGILILSHLSP